MFLTLLAAASCSSPEPADLILTNGRIYLVDESFGMAEALAIRDGKILAAGNQKEIEQAYRAEQTIDLEGNFVYPGFIDAHCHFTGYGYNLRNADLVGTTSFDQIVDLLKKHQAEFPSEWILGRGWDQNDWPEKKFPTRDLLDQAFPDHPVLITRIDGHAALVNQVALDRAGIGPGTRIEGGEVIVENGKVTGVLVDNAISLVSRLIPEPGRDEQIQALLGAQKNCFAVGLTSVQDAGLSAEEVETIDSLQRSGDLKMRIYAMLHPTEENFERYIRKGIYKTDRLNVRSIKLFADGALGSRGALMIEPYSDDPGNHGLMVDDPAHLEKMCAEAYKYNYQVNTHCIGDSANRFMLHLYGKFLLRDNDRRWRIEHAQVVAPSDFSLFGKSAVIPSIQTTHATSDMYWAEERLGPERIKGAYAYQELLKQNGWLPNGSDFPVESINPIYGFYAGVARRDQSGFPEGGFQMENALSREQALRAMTIWAARAAFEENEKGSLEPGKDADVVVLDLDLMQAPEEGLFKAKVLMTFIAGEKVFDASSPEDQK